MFKGQKYDSEAGVLGTNGPKREQEFGQVAR